MVIPVILTGELIVTNVPLSEILELVTELGLLNLAKALVVPEPVIPDTAEAVAQPIPEPVTVKY